jgi:erythromycin esterase
MAPNGKAWTVALLIGCSLAGVQSVPALRDARGTTAMLQVRANTRDSASAWLRARTAAVTSGRADTTAIDAKFDSVARNARVIGLGEATHGSREFGDVRLRLTQRAIEHAGYRIVALEGSVVRLSRLNDYVAGRAPTLDTEVVEAGAQWIGRRTERQLVAWLRAWNGRHPKDPVWLVGVDPQNFLLAVPELRDFLRRAYGDRIATVWTAIEREVAAADSQTYVFRDSGVDTVVRRQLFELVAALQLDAPILRRLYGDPAYERAAEALAVIAEFADFNDARSAMVGHWRDWYMAARVLQALSQRQGAKAVYWAHNAHVAHAAGRSATAINAPSGSVLRAILGCGYQAVAMTLGAGTFVAQRVNDPENRLAIDSLPPNAEESVERMMSSVAPTTALAMWGCVDDAAPMPSRLRRPQQMRRVGVDWSPGSDAAAANSRTLLVRDYDGLVYIPRVTADEAPADRPVIPTRGRRAR